MMKRLITGVILIIVASSTLLHPAVAQESGQYREPYRPQFHYSPPQWWMNDPNGLVYYEGEYHLFYQYHPGSLVWGSMHWGHAVSTDLVHWETLPIALYPDELGTIFSGSVVVDAANTSGLVPGGELVAIYSYDTQTQGIAYSIDNGRTWTKYARNPVIDALAPDFRDPKVFWHQETGRWVMVISAGKEVRFFVSPNLMDWEETSSFASNFFTLGVWEMPDLFPLEFQGKTKWALIVNVGSGGPASGSGTMYFIGDFDGERFVADETSDILWLDYGPDDYAGTTWNNAPDGRRIFIGWMNNWRYADRIPTDPWRGAMTIPREIRLVDTPNGPRLAQQPVQSIEQLREPVGTWENMSVEGENMLPNVKGRALEILADFEIGTAPVFGLQLQHGDVEFASVFYDVQGEQLYISRPLSGITGFTRSFSAPLAPEDGRITLRILLDESSLEVFAGAGEVVLTSQQFIPPKVDDVVLFADDGSAELVSLQVYKLASVWNTN